MESNTSKWYKQRLYIKPVGEKKKKKKNMVIPIPILYEFKNPLHSIITPSNSKLKCPFISFIFPWWHLKRSTWPKGIWVIKWVCMTMVKTRIATHWIKPCETTVLCRAAHWVESWEVIILCGAAHGIKSREGFLFGRTSVSGTERVISREIIKERILCSSPTVSWWGASSRSWWARNRIIKPKWTLFWKKLLLPCGESLFLGLAVKCTVLIFMQWYNWKKDMNSP